MRVVLKALRLTLRSNLFLICGLLSGALLSIVINHLNFPQQTCIELSAESRWDSSDYEPVINLAGKPLKARKQPQELVRPRYYSTELGIKEKLFVGILASPNHLSTTAQALNATLGPLVSKLVIFVESTGQQQMSLVNGLVTFGDSRIILKPFHAIKYIIDNFLKEYEYFYLIKSNYYVNGYRLLEIVRKLNVGDEIHWGFIYDDDPLISYCSLETGILINGNILRRVASTLDWCVQNAFSDSDDANIGRCVMHAANTPCKNPGLFNSYKIPTTKNSDTLDVSKLLRQPNFQTALSIGPLAKAEYFYLLHNETIKTELNVINKRISELVTQIGNITVTLPNNKTEQASWPAAASRGNKPINRFDLLRWDYFTEHEIYLKNDYNVVDRNSGVIDLIDINIIIQKAEEYLNITYKGQLQWKRLLNGYRKFDPSRGMDYILDVAVADINHNHNLVQKRLALCKPLGQVELIPVPYVTEVTRVHLVLFVSIETKEEVAAFLDSYATICMAKKERTFLLLVFLYESDHPGKGEKDDIFADTKATAQKLSHRYRKDNNNRVAWLSIKLPRLIRSKLVHANGLLKILITDLIIRKFVADNLVLIATPFMELRLDYLNRVRMNTIKGSQWFSPIPFSEFHPDLVYNAELPKPKELDINKNYGHYDVFDFDHLSFYVKDYKTVREKVEHLLPVATTDRDLSPTLEKLDANLIALKKNSLYGLLIRFGGEQLRIFRAVEPSLRVHHAEVTCPLDQESDICLKRRDYNMGPRTTLGKIVLDRKLAFNTIQTYGRPIAK